MDREKLFEKFINECANKPLKFCGQGNPNADILIIGKESTDTSDTIESIICRNIELCRNKMERDAPRPIYPKNKTWANYQDLLDEIYNRKSDYDDKWDFEKYAFTTELSSIPRKKSNYSEAKPSIKDRLRFFEKSEFIKSFPVVILACGGYIKNNDKVREIDDTFHVEFDGEHKGRHKSEQGKLWFTTHHSKSDARKLVIHTWQFSLGHTLPGEKEWLMDKLAAIIRDHLRKLGLI